MKGIFLIIPVWGEEHVGRLAQYAIPSLLAPGNIPALRKEWPVTALIHTNRADAQRLSSHDALRHLRESCDVEIVEHGLDVEGMKQALHPGHGHSGTMMKMCHNHGIARAWTDGFGFCPLAADQFFADGWGKSILAAIGKGKRAVGEVGLRLPNRFTIALDAARTNGVIALSPVKASGYLLDALHANNEMPPDHDVGAVSGLSMSVPSKRGYLTRAQHLAIDFMFAKKGPVFCHRSTDNDLAHQALDSWDEVEVMTSTASYITGGIEGLGTSAPPKPSEWDNASSACSFMELQAVWLKHACNEWHRHWWKTYNLWCEDGTLTAKDKEPLEKRADKIVARCLELNRRLESGEASPATLRADGAISTWW